MLFFENVSGKVLTHQATSQRALAAYVGNEHYKNINRFLRGVEFKKNRNNLQEELTGLDYILLNFIYGCLICDAANKFVVLQSQLAPRAQTLKHVTLDRGEKVSDELAGRRVANVLRLPGVTSFSVHKEGSEYFHSSKTTRTKLHGDYRNHPVMNHEEGEIIFAHGEQLQYTRNPQDGFFAKLVRSPDYVKLGSYWSDYALLYAYINHLKLKYNDEQHSVDINEMTIEKPNHGLAHTL